MARILAVASAKGGVGKTTTTAALGVTLAETGKRVLAIDTDLGMANLGNALGIDADGATVHDVLAGRADLTDAAYEGPSGLAVVPGDTDLTAFAEADPSNLRTLLDTVDDVDYILLDTGAGLSHDTVLPLALADDVLLVTDTDPNAIGDTEKTRQVVDRLDGSVAGLVVTQVGAECDDGDLPAADSIGAPVLATIPASPAVGETSASDEPHVVADPSGPVATAYRTLARELTDETIPEPESDAVDDGAAPEVDGETDDGTADDTATETVDADEEEETADTEATDEDATDDETGDGEVDSADGDADDADPDVDDTAALTDGDVDADDTVADADTASHEGEDTDDVLVPDAEPAVASTDGEATGEDESDESDEPEESAEAEEGVYTTPLVDEAEASGVSTTDEEAEENAADDADAGDTDSDDDDEGQRSGLFGRLLG